MSFSFFSGNIALNTTISSSGISPSWTIFLKDSSRSEIDNEILIKSQTLGIWPNGYDLFTTRNGTGFIRSTTNFCCDISGISSICPWIDGLSYPSSTNIIGHVLISPDIVTAPRHASIGVGRILTFVSEDGSNTVYTRTTVAQTGSASGVGYTGGGASFITDIQLLKLDSGLPNNVVPAKLIANQSGLDSLLFPATDSYYDHSFKYPVISSLQDMRMMIMTFPALPSTRQANRQYINVGNPINIAQFSYGQNIYSPYAASSRPQLGDSGHPICLIVDGQLVMISHYYTASYGPSYMYYLSAIQSAISGLGGIQPSFVDLSRFPNIV